MRETARSIKSYFLFVGGFSLLSGLMSFGDAAGIFLVFQVFGLAVSAAFLLIGARFDDMFRDQMPIILGVLYASLAQTIGFTLLIASYGAAGMRTWIFGAIGVAVSVYLLVNVRRLKAEQTSTVASSFD